MKIDKFTKIGYFLSIACFVIGLRTMLTWSYTPRLVGTFLVLLSILIAYGCYKKTHIHEEKFDMDKKQAYMGFFLILIDIFYNTISKDSFAFFDYGVIISGFIIILLNIGFFNFLKLDKKVITFSTIFIFVTMVLYGFLFSGLPFILGNKEYNLFFEIMTKSVVLVSGYILNIIKPTIVNSNVIDFDGFSVGIGNPCSGIESISVFISAVIAYIIATRTKNLKKMLKYILIGGIILYTINILRIIIIILTGYYLGEEEMLFVHSHLGWIFFIVSMSFFWRFLIKDTDHNDLFYK